MTGTAAGAARRTTRPFRAAGTVCLAAVVTGCLRSHAAPPTAQTAVYDRTRPPVIGPPPALVLPPVISRQLPNGMRLVIVQRHGLPLTDFIFVARRGSESDPEGRAGVATLTADLLTRGTTTRSAA